MKWNAKRDELKLNGNLQQILIECQIYRVIICTNYGKQQIMKKHLRNKKRKFPLFDGDADEIR